MNLKKIIRTLFPSFFGEKDEKKYLKARKIWFIIFIPFIILLILWFTLGYYFIPNFMDIHKSLWSFIISIILLIIFVFIAASFGVSYKHRIIIFP